MRKLAAAIALVLPLLTQPAAAQTAAVDAETAGAVRDLLAKTGAVERYNQVIELVFNQMIQTAQHANPDRTMQEVGAVLRDVLLPEFKAIGPAMVELGVATWAKRFSLAEIRELNAFYDTPVGQKILREQAAMTSEMAQAAGPIAQEISRRAINKHRETLRQRGVNIPL
jgi:uncharacterized protein